MKTLERLIKENNHTNTVIEYLKVKMIYYFISLTDSTMINRQTLRELSGAVEASLTGSPPEL